MNIIKEESGQGAAEYILLFGGVIAIAIVSIVIYKKYFIGKNILKASQDINKVRSSLGPLKTLKSR